MLLLRAIATVCKRATELHRNAQSSFPSASPRTARERKATRDRVEHDEITATCLPPLQFDVFVTCSFRDTRDFEMREKKGERQREARFGFLVSASVVKHYLHCCGDLRGTRNMRNIKG